MLCIWSSESAWSQSSPFKPGEDATTPSTTTRLKLADCTGTLSILSGSICIPCCTWYRGNIFRRGSHVASCHLDQVLHRYMGRAHLPHGVNRRGIVSRAPSFQHRLGARHCHMHDAVSGTLLHGRKVHHREDDCGGYCCRPLLALHSSGTQHDRLHQPALGLTALPSG